MTTENESAVVEEVVVDDVVNTNDVEVEVESEEATKDEFANIPKKFLKNGELDKEGMIKSYLALEKRLGSKSLASEAIEDYVHESKLQYDPELSSAFKAEAQKVGLSPEQYAWVMDKYEESVSQTTITREVAEESLRQAWGKSYESQLRNAKAAWDAFAPSDLNIDEVGDNPAVLKILARVGAELGEDKPTAKNSARPIAMSEEQINEIINSKGYQYDLKKQETVRKWYEQNYKD